MNEGNVELAATLVPFVKSGAVGLRKLEKKVTLLLASRRLPERKGWWSDEEIEALLRQLAAMDSNSFAVGVGEREGRVVSRLVAKRCHGLSHGMGRSGNLAGAQPKAAGSSLLVVLTNLLVLEALQLSGDGAVKECMVVPVATGMALLLCLVALKKQRPLAKHVIWCRCDQNSAVKAVAMSGLSLVPVAGLVKGDAIVTDIESIGRLLQELGSDSVACVLTTTSCFAPRVPDDVEAMARLCAERGVPHLVNNAYGVQCASIMKQLARAQRVGRVDGYVQSTDKNFCVPVGGAVIAGPITSLAAAEYAGRASSGPIVDVFVTLLSLGSAGWKEMLEERERLAVWMRSELRAGKAGLKLLETEANPISFALKVEGRDAKMLGSMLFTRNLTGHRVCERNAKTTDSFVNWGQHLPLYEPAEAYLTVAVSVGATREELETALTIIVKTVREKSKRDAKKAL